MEPKRLGLLRDLVPGVPLIGVLLNPEFAPASHYLQEVEEAARSIDQRILIANASTDEELETAFAALIRAHVGALLVTADPYFDTRREQIVAFAARQRLPSIYQFREYAVAGGLLGYGVSITDAYRNCGVYTAKILKGAKPALTLARAVDDPALRRKSWLACAPTPPVRWHLRGCAMIKSAANPGRALPGNLACRG